MRNLIIEPRMLPTEIALDYVGFSRSVFSKIRKDLEEKHAFPKPHPITKKYDRKALDKWLDKTGGVLSEKDRAETGILEKIRNGDI